MIKKNKGLRETKTEKYKESKTKISRLPLTPVTLAVSREWQGTGEQFTGTGCPSAPFKPKLKGGVNSIASQDNPERMVLCRAFTLSTREASCWITVDRGLNKHGFKVTEGRFHCTKRFPHAVDKISMRTGDHSISRLANKADEKVLKLLIFLAKDVQRRESQGSSAGNASCQRFLHRERRLVLEQDLIFCDFNPYDVDKLRKKLRHEENVHRALERAFTRPLGTLPRLSPFLSPKTQELLAEVAVLEEEVVRLEEQIEHLRQGLNHETVQLFSSTKHKEPTENAEPPTPKKPELRRSTSWGHSPAQESDRGRRDFVVGSSLASMKGCSPDRTVRTPNRTLKNGGLHKRQASLSSVSETRGLFFLTQAINSNHPHYKGLEEVEPLKPPKGQQKNPGLPKISYEKENHLHMTNKNIHTVPQASKLKSGARKQCSLKNKALNMQPLTKAENTTVTPNFGPRKIPCLSVLEDGKSTQPNKLSEEIVKCLLSIFLKLTKPSLGTEYETSSMMSQSTVSTISSRSYVSRSSLSCKTPMDRSEEIYFRDPYGVCVESASRDIGPYKHLHDITASSFDLTRIPSSASLLRRLRRSLSMEYQLLPKSCLICNEQKGYIPHEWLGFVIGFLSDMLGGLQAVLNVGGHLMNALAIEHYILRPPHHSKDADWKDGKTDEEAMMRNVYGLEWSEPLVTFALCCGSWSSPAVRVYTAAEVEIELEVAKKEYLQAAISVTLKKKVLIPKLLDWYMRDFAKDTKSLLEWICEQLPSSFRKAVEECLKGKKEFISQVIEVMPYEFDFRYLFAS
eukprot:Gb_10011 [translate_table: standard]